MYYPCAKKKKSNAVMCGMNDSSSRRRGPPQGNYEDRRRSAGYRRSWSRERERERFAPKRMFRIFGTEEDKVNCSFYFKIGACRHGERCSRLHVKPNFSQTLLLAHFYMPPSEEDGFDSIADDSDPRGSGIRGRNERKEKALPSGVNIPHSTRRMAEDYEYYENFYEDVLREMAKYGDVQELVVCQNLGDHMFGNTYVKFATEEQAAKALADIRGRYYRGRIIQAEYSPVTDFREGRCRQFDERDCARGDFCNFLHLKKIPRWAQRYFDMTRTRNCYRRDRKFERDEKDEDGDLWPGYHYRGTSSERRSIIEEWNKILDKKRERMADQVKSQPQSDPDAFAAVSSALQSLQGSIGSLPGAAAGTAGIDPHTAGVQASHPFVNPERMRMIQGL